MLWTDLVRTVRRNRAAAWESALLFALMAVAGLVAYEYDVFSNPPGTPPQKHIIELDEALVLATLLCVGLLILALHFLFSQRQELARRMDAEHRARELALQDTLTGLPNRRRFDQELTAALAAPPRSAGTHAVFLLDLDDFKRINDVYGHGAGDEVLVNVALRLQRAVREGNLVARFGGDEFTILADHLAGSEDATNVALRLITEFGEPVAIGSIRHQVGVSIGIALAPKDGQDNTEILRKADIALYRAKTEPGCAFRFFEVEMDAQVRERDLIERELRLAISRATIEAYYQPLIDLRTQKVVGFEALARWHHATLGNVPPDRFIPVAESCGLLGELTDGLLRQAAKSACKWSEEVVLAFNISPSQLKDQTLGLRILSILAETGLSPHRLEIELTEAALVRDMQSAQRILGALRNAGVHITLDDFGTGYSSLYHLRNFKIDKIKIDRSFVQNMEREAEAAALVRALVGLGQGLGLTVIAEGVEHPAQAAALLAQGCQQGQGYLFSRAMPAARTAEFIAAHMPQAGSTGRING